MPLREIPAADLVRDKAHVRAESRTIKRSVVTAGIGFPHAATAIQVIPGVDR